MILRHEFTPIDNRRLAHLCGPTDAHLRTVESAFDVRIAHRQAAFRIEGAKPRAEAALVVLRELYERATHSLDPQAVARDLSEAAAVRDASVDATTWPLDKLIGHIVSTHHAYVRAQIPVIQGYATKLARRHGDRVPAVAQVARVFDEMAHELSRHMAKEEDILFPYIEAMVVAKNTCTSFRDTAETASSPKRSCSALYPAAGPCSSEIRTTSSAARGAG